MEQKIELNKKILENNSIHSANPKARFCFNGLKNLPTSPFNITFSNYPCCFRVNLLYNLLYMIKHLRRPKWRLAMYIIAGVCVILLLANTVICAVLTNKARDAFKQLPTNLQVNFSSIHANLFNASLSIIGINMHYTPYSSKPQNTHAIYCQSISLKGINFFKMIFSTKLSASKLTADGGYIKLDSFLLAKRDSAQTIKLPQIPFGNISIGNFILHETSIWLHSENAEHLLANANIDISGIKIADIHKPLATNNLRFEGIDATLSNIRYSIPTANHTVQVKTITLNSKQGVLQIDSLQITPQYNKAANDSLNKQAGTTINANIAGITLSNINFLQLLSGKFVAYNISINNPKISIYSNYTGQQLSLPKAFNQTLSTININTLNIINPNFRFEGYTNEEKHKTATQQPLPFTHLSINHFNIINATIAAQYNTTNKLNAKGNINIDNITLDSNNKHFSAIACSLQDIECNMPGTYNKLQVNQLIVNSNKSVLMASGIKIIPLYGKLQLGRMLGHQADYIDATIASIQLVKPAILKMLDKKLVADKIIINEIKAYVFRDRRLTRLQKLQPLPAASLKIIPLNVQVNTLQVNHASVNYEEFPKDGVQTGAIKVEKMNISITPFINAASSNTKSRLTTHVDGAIMGSGSMEANISMPLNPNEDYTVKGAINNLDLTTLNSAAENLGKFHIESGLLDKLDFQFNFNNVKSTGKIVGVYHNLVVDKLKGNDKKIAKVATFFVQHLILPKNKDESLPVNRRTGKIDYTRDPTRFPASYLLQSLLTGIKSSFTFGFLLPK